MRDSTGGRNTGFGKGLKFFNLRTLGTLRSLRSLAERLSENSENSENSEKSEGAEKSEESGGAEKSEESGGAEKSEESEESENSEGGAHPRTGGLEIVRRNRPSPTMSGAGIHGKEILMGGRWDRKGSGGWLKRIKYACGMKFAPKSAMIFRFLC